MFIERPIDQFVPGPPGVAGCHDLGRGLLSVDAPISSRRAVRTDVADQTRGGIGPGQYRGRAWTREYGQLRSASANLPRIAKGAGDASDFGGTCRHFAIAGIANGTFPMREFGKNGSRVDTVPAGQISEMKSSSIRYSPFAIRLEAEASS